MANLYRLLSGVSEPKPNEFVSRVASSPGFLSPEECQKVIELSANLPEEQGGIYTKSTNGGALTHERSRNREDVRSSKVRWMPPELENMWLYDRLETAIEKLNQAYRFDLYGFEMLQVSTYGVGGHFGWHIDTGGEDESTRKLSLSVQLSDSSDYEGGDLEFIGVSGDHPRSIGSLIAFPSFLAHRVTPVTRGTRISLVGWIHGPPVR
jgi:PKHD-type hydroxylase